MKVNNIKTKQELDIYCDNYQYCTGCPLNNVVQDLKIACEDIIQYKKYFSAEVLNIDIGEKKSLLTTDERNYLKCALSNFPQKSITHICIGDDKVFLRPSIYCTFTNDFMIEKKFDFKGLDTHTMYSLDLLELD